MIKKIVPYLFIILLVACDESKREKKEVVAGNNQLTETEKKTVGNCYLMAVVRKDGINMAVNQLVQRGK
jgi:uncharacterized lipoprotein